MKVISLVKKYINKYLLKQEIKKYKVFDNLYYFKKDNKVKKILFYFPDYEFMHLGDHFFFEPAMRELKKQGFEVAVSPVKLMEFYFENYYIEKKESFEKYDLIITKAEFYDKFKDKLKKHNVIFIDTSYPYIKEPICLDIIKKLYFVLGIDSEEINDRPTVLETFDGSLELDTNYKYILFNNYVDSGFFRINQKKLNDLNKKILELKSKTGAKIIHTGSKNDKLKDNNKYNFVDIDLRGKTTVKDIFYLLSQQNVLYNVSFDAFQMHVAFLYNKKSFIKFRGRFLKKNTDFIINYVNPPFRVKNKKDLIDYI
jgi:hypothetical protein